MPTTEDMPGGSPDVGRRLAYLWTRGRFGLGAVEQGSYDDSPMISVRHVLLRHFNPSSDRRIC